MYDDRDIARILDATHIEDVVRDFVPLQESGHNYKCCCPVHNERTPSFVVTPSKTCTIVSGVTSEAMPLTS